MIYYVNIQAGREGNGSKETPFRHIDDAAKVARPGDKVIVAPGIYREKVTPVFAGTEENRIVYRSEKPLGAVITGSEEAKGWEKTEDGLWKISICNGIFGDYNPYTTFVCGDWYFAPTIRHTGCVVMNDRMMYETTSREACAKAEPDPCSWVKEESVYQWYTEQEDGKTVIYANFQGKNPNEEQVEIIVRRNCFMPDENGIGYITEIGRAHV